MIFRLVDAPQRGVEPAVDHLGGEFLVLVRPMEVRQQPTERGVVRRVGMADPDTGDLRQRIARRGVGTFGEQLTHRRDQRREKLGLVRVELRGDPDGLAAALRFQVRTSQCLPPTVGFAPPGDEGPVPGG